MYTQYKSICILIALLKEHNIRHVVISPGSRMRDFLLSVEEDPFFTCYSVVDERSAAYFAIGISQELNVPVAITCTSSTATTNYLPGITEAFYQGVPLLVLTGDRDPYMLGQQEDQMIDQINMYGKVVRKFVQLPIVNTDADFWYCERLINEAILELDHRGKGPVQINVPVPAIITWPTEYVDSLPEVRVIKRVTFKEDKTEMLQEKLQEIKNAQKILVLIGQKTNSVQEELFIRFFKKYNCVFHAEHMGNLNIEGKINLAMLSQGLLDTEFDDFLPDVVISCYGTLGISRNLKETFRKKKINHWLINENGNVVDAYKNLTTIFECEPTFFFNYFIEHAEVDLKNNEVYYNKWLEKYQAISIPDTPFSHVSVIRDFLKRMPEKSLLHLSILNSIRISHFFELPADTRVYANIGTDGIDGCMSTFFGQSVVSQRLSFLIIGDLSFFYDMNSLRIRHIRNNVRILLINNYGGNEFYQQPIRSTTDNSIGAKHGNKAEGWAESVGFHYMTAQNEQEYNSKLNDFFKPVSDTPVLFEVFTKQMTDVDSLRLVQKSIRNIFDKNAALKNTVRSVLGETGIKTIKNILGKK
ncbi:2-succinyl-5-enolpyruvyl-6-hydroxy-3-cyclohexene-1-carboxylic-acid synthase [uncultured Bacteroides sp.]|uniref:2-succinyl-5-enolpyruvyl-6-hydroxy-3- cyclohexene-1-carboxylic-acid synthase n=1 Tax=uncultured Bacteroides sp. TaxID=162156 RepID=UPI002AAA93FB|nr:2-succinyl-5-enolpyruvyl-6-hydroxy-3-cyclohexene-1-carboxylic-acid synthase [uncultured Bacteroides sp.]